MLGIEAYYIRDWYTLHLVAYTPVLILLSLWFFIPESPRWLIINGRIKEAKAIISQVGKENRRQVPDHLMASKAEEGETPTETETETDSSVLGIFKSPRMGLRTLNMYQIMISSEIRPNLKYV